MRFERFKRRQPLIFSEHAAPVRFPFRCAPSQMQGQSRRNRRIVVDGEPDSALDRPASRRNVFGSRRPERNLAVVLAPVVNVRGEKACRHPQLSHAIQLILSHGLRMDQRVPMVGSRNCIQNPIKRVKHDVRSRVAVDVDMHLETRFMQRQNLLEHAFGGNRRFAAVADIPVERLEIRLRQASRLNVQRPVREKLSRTEPDKSAFGQHELQSILAEFGLKMPGGKHNKIRHPWQRIFREVDEVAQQRFRRPRVLGHRHALAEIFPTGIRGGFSELGWSNSELGISERAHDRHPFKQAGQSAARMITSESAAVRVGG